MSSQDPFETIEKFSCGERWATYYSHLKQKQICFAFVPTEKERNKWKIGGFTKLKHLLLFLEKINHSLDKFEIVFFRGDYPQPYFTKQENGKTRYFINIDTYMEYGTTLDSVISELKIIQYSRKIWYDFSKRVPQKFFNGEPSSALVEELRNSYFTVVERLINEFDKMGDEQREVLKKAFEHSKLGTEVIKQYISLNPDAPKVQLKIFLEVIEKLGEEEVGELLNSILKSKVSRLFIKQVSKLPTKEQNKIFKKIPEMSKMLDRYEKLKKSLKEFEKVVREHQNSFKKDEKEIHQLLIKDYWLLGIEYFDKKILSDIDANGKLTGETKIGNRKHADFIIERIDGLDKCVIIEIEEANDRIFNKDGTLSKDVYDGINQAVDYYIEQKSKGFNSKGIAVIGSALGKKFTEAEKEKLILLKETFHNVEVLTYDNIIDKAKNTLHFWESYEPLEKKI